MKYPLASVSILISVQLAGLLFGQEGERELPSFKDQSRELFAFDVDGKWGCADRSGTTVIAPRFSWVGDFRNGGAPAALKGAYGYVQRNGDFTSIPNITDCYPLSNGLGRVQERLSNSSAMVGKPFRLNFVDVKGKLVSEKWYDAAGDFSQGLARVNVEARAPFTSGKWGFIDASGATAIDFQYEDARDFNDGLAAVKQNGKWGLIDRTGKMAIAPSYHTVSVSEGRAPFIERDWGFINKAGEKVIPPQFYRVHEFGDGGIAAAARRPKERSGFIDAAGKEVISPQFDETSVGRQGRILVRIEDRYGFIDTQGRMVIRPEYYNAEDFNGGLALVGGGHSAQYIDRDGKRVSYRSR